MFNSHITKHEQMQNKQYRSKKSNGHHLVSKEVLFTKEKDKHKDRKRREADTCVMMGRILLCLLLLHLFYSCFTLMLQS